MFHSSLLRRQRGGPPMLESGDGGQQLRLRAALTASTGQAASSSTRWALLPSSSLPTGDRRRSPITMNSASVGLGRVDQLLGRIEGVRAPPGPRTAPRRRPAARSSSLELGVRCGVHDQQRGAAQLRLAHRPLQGRPALGLRGVADHDHRTAGRPPPPGRESPSSPSFAFLPRMDRFVAVHQLQIGRRACRAAPPSGTRRPAPAATTSAVCQVAPLAAAGSAAR